MAEPAAQPSGVPAAVWAALLAREPVTHRREVIGDAAAFAREIAPDFWEWGASGRRYDRAHVRAVVLERLAGRLPDSLDEGFTIEDAAVRLLAPGLYQITYTLHGQGRVTRRSTLYREAGGAFQAVFHQGTIVADAEQ